jgi:hypothetical protein
MQQQPKKQPEQSNKPQRTNSNLSQQQGKFFVNISGHLIGS